MSRGRWLAAGLLGGLAAWAVVLGLHLNPATDLSRLQGGERPATGAVPANATPADLYATACASCHLANGAGNHPVFPPLAGSPWVTGDAERLVRLSLHGLSGPIEVNGVAYSGMMPGFAHLDDARLAQVLTHVRTSWGNRADVVTAEDVAAVRRATADRQWPWTADELSRDAP